MASTGAGVSRGVTPALQFGDMSASDPSTRLVLLTTDRPLPNNAGARALGVVTGPGKPVRDVICMLSQKDLDRLEALAAGDPLTE